MIIYFSFEELTHSGKGILEVIITPSHIISNSILKLHFVHWINLL
jgi:hypothetical protein